MPSSGWERIAEYYAQMGGTTPGGEAPKLAPHMHPRTSIFTCKACQVQERLTLPDSYTAARCWCCGSDEETMPRPAPRPEPAQEETPSHV